MSTSNEWEEWYLTPDGWVEGSHKEDGCSQVAVSEPSNILLFRRYQEYWGGPRQQFYYTSCDRTKDLAEIGRCLDKYGDHPSKWCRRVYQERRG